MMLRARMMALLASALLLALVVPAPTTGQGSGPCAGVSSLQVPTYNVPASVFGDSVSFLVSSCLIGPSSPSSTVTVTINSKPVRTATAPITISATTTVTVTDVPAGTHAYVLRIDVPATASNAATASSTPGVIVVEDVLGEMAEQLASLRAELEDLSAEVEDVNTNSTKVKVEKILGDVRKELDGVQDEIEDFNADAGERIAQVAAQQNATQALLAQFAPSAQAQLKTLQDSQADIDSKATTASGASKTTSVVVLLVSAITLAGAGYLFVQAQKRHKQTMVLLLAFAARAGVTADSKEFKTALEALEG